MADVKRNDSVDVTTQDARTFRQASERGVVHDSGAHWHTRVRDNTAPVNSFTAKTWTKVLSVCLSFLLAFMMFDATAFPSYANEVNDEATPLAESGEALPVEEDSGDQAAPEQPDTAWVTEFVAADMDPEALSELAPDGLVAAEEVLPQVTVAAEGAVEADLAGRIAPTLVAYGKPFSAAQGFFVKDGAVRADFEMGDRGALLNGGHLAGSKEGDRFVLTLEVPYLYLDAQGETATTYSEEEWRYHTAVNEVAASVTAGEEDAPVDAEAAAETARAKAAEGVSPTAPRAVVQAETAPEGWSLFQEHDGAYLPVTDEALAAGVSGRLVLRYDGNDGKLDASASLPQLQLGLVGRVPSGTLVSVYYGYEYHSFTAKTVEGEPAPEPQYGDVKRGAAGSIVLTDEANDSAAAMTATLVSASMPRTADGAGKSYLAHLIRYEVPEKAPAVTAIALGALYPSDAEGRGSVPMETVMAFKVGEGDEPEGNRAEGVVDTSKEAREGNTFVGVPGEGGIIVLDVTGLSDEQISSINPMKASTIEALGLEPLPYSVAADGRIQLARSGSEGAIEPGESRTLYVAAPYDEASVAFEEGAAESAPVTAAFDAQISTVASGDNMVVAQCMTDRPVFAAVEPGDAYLTDEESEAAAAARPTLPGLSGLPATEPNDDPEGTEGVEGVEGNEPESDEPAADDPAATEPEAAAPGENYALHPESAPVQLLTAATGASFLTARAAASPSIKPFANEKVEKLADTYLDPNLHIGNGTPVDGATNTVMIKTSEQVYMSLQPNPTYKSGFLGKSDIYEMEDRREAAVVFRLDIPYLYFNDKGSVETLDAAEWEKKNTEAQSPNLKFRNDHQRLAYFPDTDAINRYDFSQDGKNWYTVEEMTDDENGFIPKGLSGTWYVRYKGTGDKLYQLHPGALTLTGQVRFVGTVPDNTGATILLGYKYQTLTNADGTEKVGYQPTEVEPGRKRADGAQNVLRATFIQTNLKWELVNSSLNTPVLWDRYNYAVYKVSVENVSDTRDSEIDFINYVLMFDAATGSTSGIRAEDLLTWKSTDGSVSFSKNTSMKYDDTGATYIGKPKQGGALIYDVSKLTDEEIRQIDMVDFSNVADFNLTEMPYATGGKPGQITVDIHETKMPYGKHLFSHTDKANQSVSPDFEPEEDESNRHTLLVAMPYTTNYGNGAGGYSKARLRALATVNFGNRGYDSAGNSNDYQWMKEKTITSSFTAPKHEVALAKWSRNVANPATKSASERAPLGEMVTYTIDSMANKGNTPLFGLDDKTTYGAELSDQLPSGFQLSGLTVRVNASGESRLSGTGDDAHRVADLSDWYDTASGNAVLQFQVKDASNNVSWKNLPVGFTEIERAADDSYAVYRLGEVDDVENGIAEKLEAMKVAAVPGHHVKAGDSAFTHEFTGTFRLLFKHSLPADTAIASSVDVTGLMMERTSNGDYGRYDNKADITYGKRLWSVNPDGYNQPKETTKAVKATFIPVDPAPIDQAKVFSMYDGSGRADVNMTTEADSRNALVDTANAGYRFRFANTSTSRMAPAVIEIGPVPDGRDPITSPGGGAPTIPSVKAPKFVTSQIRLGSGFFGADPAAVVDSITLTYYGTTAPADVTKLTKDIRLADFTAELKDGVPTGYYYYNLPTDVGYLTNVTMNLKSFKANMTVADAQALVELKGTPVDVGNITVGSSFRTDYINPASNLQVSDSAMLHSMYVPIKPEVTASYGWVDNAGASRANSAVPYRWGDMEDETAYFRYDLSNNSEYEMKGFGMDVVVNGASKQNDGTRDAWRGFIARSVVIPGFSYGSAPVYDVNDNVTGEETRWHYNYGSVTSVDVFDTYNATASIMKAESDIRPNGSYDIESVIKAMPAAGGAHTFADGTVLTLAANGTVTLKVATDGLVNGALSDGAAEKAPVKMVRVRFGRVDKKLAAGNCPVVYLYGRADTHSNVRTDVHAFATTAVYGPDMQLPRGTRKEGNSRNYLEHNATMTFGTFASNVSWTVTKNKNVRPNVGTESTGQNVEVANYSDGNSYNFTIKNAGLNRADDATVSVNIDDLSPYLKDPVNDVQGFKTRTVTFNEAVFNFGSTVRIDNTPAKLGSALQKATFYFRDVVDDGSGNMGAVSKGQTVELTLAELQALYASGKDAAGNFAIDMTTDKFASVADLYLEHIDLAYSEIDPHFAAGNKHVNADKNRDVTIKLTGKVNHWYNNKVSEGTLTGNSPLEYSKVRATAAVTQTAPLDHPNNKNSVTAFFKVYFPALALHSYGQYGPTFNEYQNNHTYGHASCSDGSYTLTSVPYDRDFKMWVNLYNERSVSTLDDLDITINAPMEYDSSLDLAGNTTADWVGFHTTKVTVNDELFQVFEHGTVGSIKFTGKPEGAGAKDAANVVWEIYPDEDYRSSARSPIPAAAARPSYFTDKDGGRYEFTADGDLIIDEKTLREHGIMNLRQVMLVKWQDMDVDPSSNKNEQNIVFEGFCDQNFDTFKNLTAKTENYLLKLRGANTIPGMVGTPVTRNDISQIYMSKMYFDTINRAGLYDSNASGTTNPANNGHRFQLNTLGSWDNCHSRHNSSYASDAEYNYALDVGYKSQVSLLADFRQVNNYYANGAPERTCHWERNNRGMSYTGPQTFNTGMVLHMTQTMPNGYFDSYYLKIHRTAAPYFDKITVTYSDGKTLEVMGDEIKALLQGAAADSVQKGYDGKAYFRLNLLARDGDGNPKASFGTGENKSDSYRHPFDDYENVSLTPGSPRFTVTKIDYVIRINQHQFKTGENRYISGEGDWTDSSTAGAALNVPDFGAWHPNVQETREAIIDRMAIEVNGRMYTETPTAGMNMYVDTALEVGGTNSGNDRPGHTALVRSDTKDKRANNNASNTALDNDKNRFASGWSFQDYHRTGDYWHHYDGVAYMRHLRSRTNVVARVDGNYTMEGINWGGTDQTQLNDYDNYVSGTSHALFGGDVNFATSFYRHTVYRGFYTGDQSYTGTWGYDTYWPNDWGWNYTAFNDKVTLGDTMPWCQPDEDLGYYGFLTTGLRVQRGVLNHLRSYDRASITFVTRQWAATEDKNADGFAIFEEQADASRTFRLTRDGLYLKNGSSWDKVSDNGLAFLTASGATGSGGYIQFQRPDEESHKVIEDYKLANGGNMIVVPLNANEFIASYTMDLGPYNGNGDITAEAKDLVVDRDGGDKDIDIQLFGRPYIYKGQKHPAFKSTTKHEGCGDVADARNHVSAWAYHFKDYNPTTGAFSKSINNYTASDSSGVHQGVNDWRGSSNASVTHRNRDTAWFLGYLIPFEYYSYLSVNPTGSAYHDTGHPNIADCQADNLTPNIVRYEARFRNNNDKNEGVDDENRAAHISQVRLRTSWNPSFTSAGDADAIRVQKIYVPKQFVPVGGHDRVDTWFRAQDFQFTVRTVRDGVNDTTATVKLSWEDMIHLGILSGTVSGTGTAATFSGDWSQSAVYPDCYVIDVEKYLRMTEIKRANADKGTDELFSLLGLNLAGYKLADGQTEADAKKAVLDKIQAGIVGHYHAVNRTNTLGGAFADDATVNLEYAAPYVTSAQFLFVSPEANREKPETMLDSGQWLGATWQTRNNTDWQHNFAFAYDGVYADREVTDFRTATETGNDPARGNWNYWSTPTFDKQGNGFGGMAMYDNLTVSDVLTRDPNKNTLVRHEDNERGYDLSHRLGALTTDMQRGKKVVLNGTEKTIFAYDADSTSVTSP